MFKKKKKKEEIDENTFYFFCLVRWGSVCLLVGFVGDFKRFP